MTSPSPRDLLSLVGLGTLCYGGWKLLLVVVEIGQANRRRAQESQRVDDAARAVRMETAREESRIIARAIGPYDANRARFAWVDDLLGPTVEVEHG